MFRLFITDSTSVAAVTSCSLVIYALALDTVACAHRHLLHIKNSNRRVGTAD